MESERILEFLMRYDTYVMSFCHVHVDYEELKLKCHSGSDFGPSSLYECTVGESVLAVRHFRITRLIHVVALL